MLADCFCSSLSRGAYVLAFFDSRVLVVFIDYTDWWLLMTDYWLLIIDCWLLIIDYWLLIIDYWLLMIDCWWLMTDYSLIIYFQRCSSSYASFWLLMIDDWLLIIRTSFILSGTHQSTQVSDDWLLIRYLLLLTFFFILADELVLYLHNREV